ncbi:MAG: CDP-alcohol phosphatidyltransferase family protein [Terriglobales bacterium]
MATPSLRSRSSLGSVLATWHYPANLLTEIRVLAVPVILTAVAYRRFGLAFAFLVAAGASDGFDGWLARRLNQHTALGRYLDPLADKGLVGGLFIALAVVGAMPWALTILVFVRDGCILISALALYAATGFHDFRPTWWGKASTTAELATVGAALLAAWLPSRFTHGLVVFGWAAVTFFVLVSGIHYAFTSAVRFHAQRG